MSCFGISITIPNPTYHFPGRSLLCRNSLEAMEPRSHRRFCLRPKNRDSAEPGRQARNSFTMAKCEVCENEYDKAFEVIVAGLGRRLRPSFSHAGAIDRAL